MNQGGRHGKDQYGAQIHIVAGAVLALLGLVEIQAYRTVDKDSGKAGNGPGEPALADEWVVKETVVRPIIDLS